MIWYVSKWDFSLISLWEPGRAFGGKSHRSVAMPLWRPSLSALSEPPATCQLRFRFSQPILIPMEVFAHGFLLQWVVVLCAFVSPIFEDRKTKYFIHIIFISSLRFFNFFPHITMKKLKLRKVELYLKSVAKPCLEPRLPQLQSLYFEPPYCMAYSNSFSVTRLRTWVNKSPLDGGRGKRSLEKTWVADH